MESDGFLYADLVNRMRQSTILQLIVAVIDPTPVIRSLIIQWKYPVLD